MDLGPFNYDLGLITSLAAAFSACGTLFIAILALITAIISLKSARAAERTADEMKRASVIAGLDLIVENIGEKGDINGLRKNLKNCLVEADEQARKPIRIKKIAEIGNPDGIKRNALDLSASFERACTFMMLVFEPDQIFRILDLWGDVFIDYWVLCFEVIKDERSRRNDEGMRISFEFSAYIAYEYFKKLGRGSELIQFMDTITEVKEYREARFISIDKRPNLNKFRFLAEKVNKYGNI